MRGRGIDSQAVKTIKKFEIEVHEVVRKALPRIIGEAVAQGITSPKSRRLRTQRQNIAERLRSKSLGYRGIHPLGHAVKKHGSKAAAAKALGMAESTFRDRLRLETGAST